MTNSDQYVKNLEKLLTLFPVRDDCLELLWDNVGRFALVYEFPQARHYWITTGTSEELCLTCAEKEIRMFNGWCPTYLVDLIDNTAREIILDVRIGLSDVVNEALK